MRKKLNCRSIYGNLNLKGRLLPSTPTFNTLYAPGSTRCNLCNEEKLSIMKADQKTLLNKRSEIFGKCCHKDRFQAGNFHRKRVRQRKSRNQTN